MISLFKPMILPFRGVRSICEQKTINNLALRLMESERFELLFCLQRQRHPQLDHGSQGEMMEKTEQRTCLQCDQPFQASVRELKRGNAKFCSLKCARRHQTEMRPKPIPNRICALCGAAFYRNEASRRNSRSGLVFCCRRHKDEAQRIENGFTEIQPDHYGDGSSGYRSKATYNLRQQCANCGYNKHPEVLEVHHKDGNHQHNALENLVFLCPTCHEEHHFLTKTGKWGHAKRKVELAENDSATSRMQTECSPN
jgi:5-methylcytosine-specific restriction endonuclease McrA